MCPGEHAALAVLGPQNCDVGLEFRGCLSVSGCVSWLLGGSGQPGRGDALGNLVIDGGQGIPECSRGLGLVAGHERAQQSVMHLAVEDREAQAVRGQGVPVAVRDAGDQLVAGQAGPGGPRRARS